MVIDYACPTCGNAPCFKHCNHCGIDIFWNDNVTHERTGKKVPLEEPYLPHTGMAPKKHNDCLKKNPPGIEGFKNRYGDQGPEGQRGEGYWWT